MTTIFRPLRRLLVCALLASPLAWAQSPSIVVSSTTSTEQSGLLRTCYRPSKRPAVST